MYTPSITVPYSAAEVSNILHQKWYVYHSAFCCKLHCLTLSYLSLPLLTFLYLSLTFCGLSWPNWALLGLTKPYFAFV